MSITHFSLDPLTIYILNISYPISYTVT